MLDELSIRRIEGHGLLAHSEQALNNVTLERSLLPVYIDSHVLNNLDDKACALLAELVRLDARQVAQLEADQLL